MDDTAALHDTKRGCLVSTTEVEDASSSLFAGLDTKAKSLISDKTGGAKVF